MAVDYIGFDPKPAKTWFKDDVILSGLIAIPTGAASGRVLTSDADGYATWQAPGGAGVNIYNSDGTQTDAVRTYTLDPTVQALIFTDVGNNYLFNFGNIGSDGIVRLGGDAMTVNFGAYDSERTMALGMDTLDSGATAPSAYHVIRDLAETDYEFGFTAFDDRALDHRISNLYYYDVSLAQDLISLSIQYDYAIPANSFIAAHIHTNLVTPVNANGWRATTSNVYLFYDGDGTVTQGSVAGVDNTGFFFNSNGQNYFTVSDTGETIIGDPGVTDISILASLTEIDYTAEIHRIIIKNWGTIGDLRQGVVRLGDLDPALNGTEFQIDDSTETFSFSKPNITIDGAAYTWPNAVGGANTVLTDVAGGGTLSWESFDTLTSGALISLGGVSGSFTTVDLKTVTVTDGLITDIAV